MDNNYLMTIVLFCLHKLDGQRTIYAILHLLNGKKSSQTIQDIHLFHLTHLFKTFSGLTRAELENIAIRLEGAGLVIQKDDGHYQVTPKGMDYLQMSLGEKPIPTCLNGWKFHHITDVLWERLSLLVQVISQLNHRNSKYFPIQRKREVHTWVKSILLDSRIDRAHIANQLYKELLVCLEKNKEIDPSILVLRLTGHKIIGLTSAQAAETLGMSTDYYHHQFIGTLHFMIGSITVNPADFPLLSRLFLDLEDTVPITLSSNKTFSMLNKGYDLEKIASIRKLKKSTIEDHVVEVALNVYSFDISPYVEKEKQELIINAAKTITSKQLKHIRQLVPDSTYFEIRLVLAKFGEEK